MSVESVMSRISSIETTIASLGASSASGVLGSTALATSSATGTGATSSAASTGTLAQDVATKFASALSAAGAASSVDAVTANGATTGGATGADLVTSASKYLGVPYVWGGESADGLDCSGLVQLALKDLGVDVPRTAREQMTQGTAVASLDDAQHGDLVVFDGGSHIGIYVGDGRMIDAPKPGKVVVERDVYETPTAIRRVLPTTAAPDVSSVAAVLAALGGGSSLASLLQGALASSSTSSTTSTSSTSSMSDLVGTADIQRLALEMLAGSAS